MHFRSHCRQFLLVFSLRLSVHMVPPDAIIQDFPRRTFADMRQSMVLTGKDARRTFGSSQGDKEPDQNVVIGCGQDYHSDNNGDDEDERTLFGAARIHRRRLAMVADASYCNNATNFFCWMSCLNIPNADSASKFVAEGQSLYCLDPAVLADSDLSTAVNKCNKNYHDDSCMGSWQPTGVGIPFQPVILPQENSSSSSALADAGKDVFCYGGTSMYMDGFHWTDTTCVIYLFNQWTLDSAGALVGACFGTIFFGIALEAVIWKRRSVVPSFPHGGWSRLIASTAFYGVQLTMGYLIMLVVMIYSAPLFVSVVVGLMMGHALFNAGGIMGSKRKEHNPTETNSNYVENGIPSRTCIRGDTVEEAMDNSSGGEDSKWGQRPCDSQTGCLPDKTNNNRNLSYQSTTSAWSTNHNNFNRTKDEAPEGITPCCQNTL